METKNGSRKVAGGTMKKSAHNILLSAVLFALIVAAFVPTIGSASAATSSITKVQSGLFATDSLTTGNTA